MTAALFDTHCHIDDPRFDADRDQVILNMREHSVQFAVAVGFDMPSSRQALLFARSHPMFYGAAGIHPHEAKTYHADDLDELAGLLRDARAVALGEIGLDYYYDLSDRPVQREVCIRQMELAFKAGMPVIYHVRDAHEDMLRLMEERKTELTGGIIHCFSGSMDQAKRYLALGFYISFAGPVTFKNAPKLWETAAFVPPDRLLLETDAPYLSPEPMRGKRNEPAYIRYVAEKIACIRGISFEELANLTTANARKVYRIPPCGTLLDGRGVH